MRNIIIDRIEDHIDGLRLSDEDKMNLKVLLRTEFNPLYRIIYDLADSDEAKFGVQARGIIRHHIGEYRLETTSGR